MGGSSGVEVGAAEVAVVGVVEAVVLLAVEFGCVAQADRKHIARIKAQVRGIYSPLVQLTIYRERIT